jgi:nucleotide sugar dehydrogenase
MKPEIMNLSRQELVNALKEGQITVCVVGLGRIGLPTAVLFAAAGAQVVGVDKSFEVINDINAGKCRFEDEPGLDRLMKSCRKLGRLRAQVDFASAVEKADIVVICVPTRVNKDKTPDYSAIIDASENVGRALRKGSLVIIESTVGITIVEKIILPILEKCSGMKVGETFSVASCPERANPSKILDSMKTVPRVIGGINSRSTETAAIIYKLVFNVRVFKVRDPSTANAIKLIENSFRDINIAFINEIAVLCKKLGLDVVEVVNGCATKWNFLPHYPGAGVGGGCIPVSSFYLIAEGKGAGYTPRLIKTAREINDWMPNYVVSLVTEGLNTVHKVLDRSKIAILGISYKPDVHDLLGTPIKPIYYHLQKKGASLAIYDPFFKGETVFGQRTHKRLDQAVENADCILIGTAHKEFKEMKLTTLAKASNMPAVLVDAWNVVDPREAQRQGFLYKGIGRERIYRTP